MSVPFDPVAFKKDESELYSAIATSYHHYAPQAFGPFVEPLLSLARLKPGQSVLDLGTGTGQVAMAAAKKVGPEGCVIGLDIAPGLIAVAKEEAKKTMIGWVEFLTGDAEILDFSNASFNVVLSHFGLIHFTDRKRALEEARRVLKPGGRLVLSVWSSPDRTVVLGLIAARIREIWPQVVQPGAPGWFDFGPLGAIETILKETGFEDLEVLRIDKPLEVPDDEAYWQILVGVSGRLRLLLERIPNDVAKRIETETKQAALTYSGPKGLIIPCEAVLAAGKRG